MQQSSFTSDLGIVQIPDHEYNNTTTTTDHHHHHHHWSFEENKAFEIAVAELSKELGSLDLMIHQIALRFPGKTVSQIEQHLKALTEDIEMIEKGLIPIPNYVESSSNHDDKQIRNGAETKSTNPPRRKGIPWTKHEHE
ncbi:protein RADIALIS-like 6 [Ziziphus jujuba]|uniref:Protein RADIALIS-like 6 n=1 Tax=Ziziphus jujuba TaxID=326968 RepID=A0ABM3ISV8_ZIZJJ|nr:protein RADIALIS-like 6 [Ziziphus jujuba]